ncbi:hypothetical protein GCM10012275_18810 [Longimycelium tulufanense]|uniref:DUF2795 domain-containing protein n=1 Tax=Longimycelium tulufanense TaxID=907463 RepID=A0A8J3CCM5_9PSEU|nr:DUF2795 domain-containing protein [Longimycelium tulufanense]GGM47994.1 hypothetical protein GCM10012275_18810 [Longimycelium tulufanense]
MANPNLTTPVTRIEIVDAIGGAFVASPVTAADLVAAADDAHARPEVLQTLRRLPARTYHSLRDLWEYLGDIPVDVED